MVSKRVADNITKQTLHMNEKIYNDILKRYESIFNSPEELEAYLIDPERYTVTAGINELIEEATSNIQTACLTNIRDIRFSQPAQKALFETVINERVGALMTRPESLEWKTEIGNIIRENSEKSWKDISKEIQKQTDIGKNNANRIARTEEHIARTNAEYIIAKERGATHFYCVCNDPCPICDEQYDGGGDSLMFELDDISNLPPVHPNCRCSAIFVKRDNEEGDE